MSVVEMIEASSVAAVISNPRLADNPIIACNAPFLRLTGYDRDEIIGRNCRFLRGPGTEGELSERLREAIRNRQPAIVEILNYRKDGSAFRNAVMVAPIFGESGALEYFLGSQAEVERMSSGQAGERAHAARANIALLSPRQRQVLVMMSAGKLNKQIAHALAVSERTVKMHRSALLRALGVSASADAIRIAVEAGL